MPLKNHSLSAQLTHDTSINEGIPKQQLQTQKFRSIEPVTEQPDASNRQVSGESQMQNINPRSLKVPVPETILKHGPSHISKDYRPAFDDTQSLDLDIDSSLDHGGSDAQYNDKTITLQTSYGPSATNHTKTLPYGTFESDFMQQASASIAFDPEPSLRGNWRTLVDRERQLQGVKPRFPDLAQQANIQPLHAAEDNRSELSDNGFEDNPDNWQASPSRAKSVPVMPKSPVTSKKLSHRPFQKPVKNGDRNLPPKDDQQAEAFNLPDREALENEAQPRKPNRFKAYKATELPINVDSPEPQELQKDPTKFSSKVSSYQESSSEEDRGPPEQSTGSKRHFSELDYDDAQLQSMKFSEFNELPFLTDPRKPISQPALDVNGNPMNLMQRLNNLSKMPPEDQTAMFNSFTDTDNEQVPSYFLEQIQTLMKKQMQLQLEKRKIALRYEMEVKKQQRLTEIKSRDVDEELKGLKKGGNELIEGRAKGLVAMPK